MKAAGMRGNLRSALRKSATKHPMARYDRLPPELRLWLAQAALPWSARSCLKLWHKALRSAGGDVAMALARLDRAEAQSLAKDAAKIWGPCYPAGQVSPK